MADEFCKTTNVQTVEQPNPKKTAAEVRDSLRDGHVKEWTNKPQHGYLARKQQCQQAYNKQATNAWLNDGFMSSHVEGYICAIQEQEIRTRLLIKQRENPESNNKCRYCNSMEESIFHILNSCSHLSTSMYLPVRHNEVAKVIYHELIEMHQNIEKRRNPETITKTSDFEMWWDKKVSVQPTVEHNRPDIVYWNFQEKKCLIIDICVPLDVNVAREEKEKCDRYVILASRLQRLYPQYKYEIVPIVIGSTGYVSNNLQKYIEQCGFDKKKATSIIPMLQRKALRGSLKVVKTAMKLK